MNLYEQLEQAAQAKASSVALYCDDGREITHAALHAQVRALAGALRAAPVAAGDRVLVQVGKSVEAVALYLATLRLGAVFVPLNTAYTGTELAYFVEDAEPAVCVIDGEGIPEAAAAAARDCGARWLALRGGDAATLHCFETDRTLVAADGTAPAADVSGADLAAILYTSGTTGRSKGAMLSHDNLLANARTLRALWGWRDDDVLLHVLPIYHVHGLFVALHCALLEPSPVLFQTRFDVEQVLAALPRATVFMGVPTHYVRLLEHPGLDRSRTAGMRLFVSGSAPLRSETFEAFEARTGQRILERYGMTEAGMITSNPLGGPRIGGTVGHPLPDVELRLLDEEGQDVADGEIGTIAIRGPNVFRGYWRKPEQTAAEFVDGWFLTGDLAERDAEGRVSIVGRGKDLVISGGLNVYPKEIEVALDGDDAVAESAVIGVPHADFGEAVVAVVVPREAAVDEQALRARMKERLAGFKVPLRILEVPELPRNVMGKVQKNLLRERFAGLFSGAD